MVILVKIFKANDYFKPEDGKYLETRLVISKFINLVLTKNNFQFDDTNYNQVLCTALGTKITSFLNFCSKRLLLLYC